MRPDSQNMKDLTFADRDEFLRQPIAEKLIQLLLSDIDVSPMVIDGQWGTGKTEFCHKLINELDKTDKNPRIAYIDAFKADHANEPMATLIAAIANLLEDEGQLSTFRANAIPVLRFGLKTLGKAGVGWVLKQNAENIGDEFEDVIRDASHESINIAIEKTIKDHQSIEGSLSVFREALMEITKDDPLILFVDELDRCKPDFAISMLESIKHVFDLPNVKFVLVCNLVQLKDSINHCYGTGIDAQRYLDKFIRYSFTLAVEFTTDQYSYTLASVSHANKLIHTSQLLSGTALHQPGVFHLIEILIKTNNLSLREVETFVRHLEIWHILKDNKGFDENLVFGYALIYIFCIYIFCFETEITVDLLSGNVNANKIVPLLGISKHELSETDNGDMLARIISVIFILISNSKIPGWDPDNQSETGFWREKITSLFRTGGFPPDMDQIPVIINGVFRRMRLEK